MQGGLDDFFSRRNQQAECEEGDADGKYPWDPGALGVNILPNGQSQPAGRWESASFGRE